jgi:ABC-type nitrate/sulfonate/bicarbonate transport system substrate-binding protein
VPNGGLLVLKNSSIRSASDLKGKKIAVAALGGLPDYSLREYLKKAGLSLSDVQELVVPYQNFYQALESHQVDAIYLWQDNFYYDLAQGDVRIVYEEKDTVGDTICGGYVFTDDFIAKHPDIVKGFVAAIVKAWDWEDQHPQEFRQIANDWYVAHKIDAAASAYITTSGTRPHALIEDIDFTTYEDFLVQDGKIRKGQVKASDVYTNEFNPYYNK